MIVHRAPAALEQQLYVAGAGPRGLDNFNLTVVLRFSGPFRRASVDHAVESLIERHEALRTTLRRVDDGLEQAIWDVLPCPIEDVDIRRSPDQLRARLLELADADTQLCESPLLSVRVFTLGRSDHVVAIRLHHAIADGWSCPLVESEFRELYLAHAAGRPSSLEPPTAQFRHYVELEQAAVSPASRACWQARLAGRRPQVEQLPTEPAMVRRAWLCRAMPSLTASATTGLGQLAREARVSRTTAALAGVASTFLGWGSDTVRIGVVHANRYRPELRGVVGPIADTIPVDIDLAGDPSYRELIARTQDAWLTSLAARLSGFQLGQVTQRDLVNGENIICDVVFNYLPSADANVAAAPAQRHDDAVQIEAVDVPLSERRILGGRGMAMATSIVVFGEDERGEPHGSLFAQEGTASDEALEQVGGAIVSTLTRAIERPTRPLRALLGS